MKKIRPDGIVASIKSLAYLAVLFLTLGLFLVYGWHYGTEVLYACILLSVIFVVAGIITTPSLYYNYWIKYGENKIIICRYTAMLDNGKFERRVDEILLDEIERYGHSMAMIGRNVERHRGSGVNTMEISFKLKDGRVIGFEELYFSKSQIEELKNYIFKNTGIKFIKVKNKFYRN